MSSAESTRRTQWVFSFVSLVSFVFGAPQAAAQMATAPSAAGYKQEPGVASSGMRSRKRCR